MEQANLSVRVDAKDKKEFEMFCNETGMNISTAINMFIKTVIRDYKLPFEVKVDPFYSKKNMKYLKKTINDIESGKAVLKEHELIEEDR